MNKTLSKGQSGLVWNSELNPDLPWIHMYMYIVTGYTHSLAMWWTWAQADWLPQIQWSSCSLVYVHVHVRISVHVHPSVQTELKDRVRRAHVFHLCMWGAHHVMFNWLCTLPPQTNSKPPREVVSWHPIWSSPNVQCGHAISATRIFTAPWVASVTLNRAHALAWSASIPTQCSFSHSLDPSMAGSSMPIPEWRIISSFRDWHGQSSHFTKSIDELWIILAYSIAPQLYVGIHVYT